MVFRGKLKRALDGQEVPRDDWITTANVIKLSGGEVGKETWFRSLKRKRLVKTKSETES